jgi:eukaryotic-like serine/threonine-protein kinase
VRQALAGGRYTLDRHLATGGMGTVWVSTDNALSRTVAIKILKPEYASDRAFRTRFETEARHAAGLDHPGIAKVYDFGETSDDDTPRPYLVMEYVDGQPLSVLLAPRRPLEEARVVDLIAQTAEALQAAHDKGIVHRDVKPANLLITPDAKVKVTDFGIAKAASDTPITQTGTIIGTAHYLPPEQAEGKPATPRSDIYALGVVLYECLAGTRPFVGDNPVAIAISHVRETPPPLPDTVSPWLAALTMRMLAKNPEDRPASAGELARELRASGSVDGGDARTSLLGAGAALAATDDASRTQVMAPGGAGEPETDPAAARRRRMLIAAAVIGAIVLLALLIIGAVALFGGGDGADSPEEPAPTVERDNRPNNDNNENPPEEQPTDDGGNQPTEEEPTEPTDEPTDEPTETSETSEPTEEPTTEEPTTEETTEPTTEPTTEETTSRRPPTATTDTPDEEESTTP